MHGTPIQQEEKVQVKITGHKLYRDLYVFVNGKCHAMEDICEDDLPKLGLTAQQQTSVYAITYGEIHIAEDGTITAIRR